VTGPSEEAVGRIIEIVARDTYLWARTALQDSTFGWELVSDRLPIALWFARYTQVRWRLELNEKLAGCPLYLRLAPRASNALVREHEQLANAFELTREHLWPTLRTLLLRHSTHRRVVQAAKLQHAQFARTHRYGYMGTLAPKRLLLLWLSWLRLVRYGLAWCFVEVGRRGRFLSPLRQQAIRTHLIDLALRHGVDLLKKIEAIDTHGRPRDPARGALTVASRV